MASRASLTNCSVSRSSSEVPDDPAVVEQPGLEQVQQTGEQLAAGQVAGGSEQHDDMRLFHATDA